MKQLNKRTTGRIYCRIALAAVALAIGGCRTCIPKHNRVGISPAARNSIAMNAGFRETTWTTLDGVDGLESPVQYDQIEEDWYLYQDSETMHATIEQVKHEVPAEFGAIEFQHAQTPKSTPAVAAKEPQCASQKSDPAVAYFESESNDNSGLKPVDIEYIP